MILGKAAACLLLVLGLGEAVNLRHAQNAMVVSVNRLAMKYDCVNAEGSLQQHVVKYHAAERGKTHESGEGLHF